MTIGCAIYVGVAIAAKSKLYKFGFAFGSAIFGLGAILLIVI